MSRRPESVDFDRLLKLRLVVARFGEMDAARWWNTGGVLGRKGALLLSRGFPKTHQFAQARLVFAVATARCSEVFDPPGCCTLWRLPATMEDEFDSHWPKWLDEADQWTGFFEELQEPGDNLLEMMKERGLLDLLHEDSTRRMRRSAEGRAVPVTGVLNDDTITLLAAGFSRGEPGNLAVPYARLGD